VRRKAVAIARSLVAVIFLRPRLDHDEGARKRVAARFSRRPSSPFSYTGQFL
jgi:hypothetical protein